MKIMVSILSIYLISLSVFPCADVLVSDDHDTEIHLAQTDGGENHSDDTDSCTPFCQCQCCGAQITAFHSDSIDFTNPTIAEVQSVYEDRLSKEYHNTPFQPPQA